jgi:hypothetical protein
MEQQGSLYSKYYIGHGADKIIMMVGQTLFDNATSWYQEYSNQLWDGTLNFSFKYFKQEMHSRFIKSSKAKDNLQKIMKLECSGKIHDYLTQMTHLNRASKVSGPTWRDHLKQGLIQEMHTMMSLVPEPTDN